jgi:hypothetical protein
MHGVDLEQLRGERINDERVAVPEVYRNRARARIEVPLPTGVDDLAALGLDRDRQPGRARVDVLGQDVTSAQASARIETAVSA